jgi:hypothetical protein
MLTLPPAPENTLSPPDPALSRSALIIEIKKELKRVGCYTGREDDKWTTADTKASVQRFIANSNFAISTDDPTERFLDAVRTKSDRVCPVECGAREVVRNGRCVAKSCPNGFLIGPDGTCEPPNERAKSATRVPEQPIVLKPNRKLPESHASLPQETHPARSSEPHIRAALPQSVPKDESGRISIFHSSTLAREPPPHTLHINQVVHVDDHTCPGGQVKYVRGGIIGRQSRTIWCGPHP